MFKYTYIKRNAKDFYVGLDELLPETAYEIGTTWEDFIDSKWVLLSDEQVSFHKQYPEASVQEVWNMQLTPPHVRTLEEAKAEMIHKINEYDQSSNVNGFTVNGEIEGWFTADERSNYRSSIESSELLGIETLSFYVGDYLMEVKAQDAKYMLARIQLYADLCFMVTKQHKLEVEALDTIEAVDAFDYTNGYPPKLNFEVETENVEKTTTEPAGE